MGTKGLSGGMQPKGKEMISLEDMLALAASPGAQEDLFVVLADHLALECGTRPGIVVVLDQGALDDPDAYLAYVIERCGTLDN